MAWTGNFKTQIEDLAGTLTVTDDAATQQWILDGCYDVLKKAVDKYGPEEVWKFVAKSGNQTSNDIDVDEIRAIAGVFLNGIHANKGAWHLKAKYADATSIYAATSSDPVWYLDDSKLTIYPTPSGSKPANYYYVPEYSLTNWNTSTSSVDNYPSEYYYYAMLYAAIQVLHRKMLDSSTPTSPTFDSLPVAPDAPAISAIANSFSSSLSDATIAYVVATASAVTTIDVDSFTGAPTYDKPALPGSGTPTLVDFSALSTFAVAAVPPDSPSVPVISSPGVASLPSIDVSSEVPQYNGGAVFNFASAFFTTLATKTISPLDIEGTVGSLSSCPSVGAVSYDPPSATTVADSDDMLVEDIVTVTDSTVTSATDAGSNQPGFTQPSVPVFPDVSLYITEMNDFIDGEEDAELANAKADEIKVRLQDFSTELQKYQAEVQSNIQEFNEDNTIYQALLQQDLQNVQAANQTALQNMQKDLQIAQANLQKSQAEASINHAADAQQAQTNANLAHTKLLQDAVQTTQAIIANNNSIVQKYGQDLAEYQAGVAREVQEYQANLNKDIQLWQGTQSQVFQEHSQKMQDALNLFNKENTRYQAEVQAVLQKAQIDAQELSKEADLSFQADVQDYTLTLQQYQQDLGVYQATVGTEVQEYQQNLSRELETWRTKQANELQQYQIELSQYQIEVTQELNEFNKENVAFQADVQKQLAEYQSDIQIAIRNADNTTQVDLQNKAKDMEAAISDYNFGVQKYQSELQSAAHALQVASQDEQNKLAYYGQELQAYNAELASYQADVSSKIQKYQADLQVSQTDYQWIQEQYTRLKQEYLSNFAIAAPHGNEE